jgi:hypothetical protein
VGNEKMITLEQFRPYLDTDTLDDLMADTTRKAIANPKAFYLFLQRFVTYNGTYSALVPELCKQIGTSSYFLDRDHRFSLHSNRAMDVAAKVFAASIEEFKDPRTQVSHRTLAYALLDAVAEYAGLTNADLEQIAQSAPWLPTAQDQVRAGYAAQADDLPSLVRAMGFHAAAETVGGHEFSIMHSVVFGERQDDRFIQFLKQHKARFEHGMVSPWYWIVIHGHETEGVEYAHSDEALEGLRRVVQYADVSEAQVIEWAGQGFVQLFNVQVQLFEIVRREITELSRPLVTA